MVPAVIHNQVKGADRSGSCQHRGDGCWLSLPPGVQPAAGGLNLSAEALGARSVKFDEGNRGAREEALPQLQTGGPGAGSQSLVAANAQGSAVGSTKTISDTNRSPASQSPGRALRCTCREFPTPPQLAGMPQPRPISRIRSCEYRKQARRVRGHLSWHTRSQPASTRSGLALHEV